MSASSDSHDGSGSEQSLVLADADQGRAWIARALVRLGHPGLIDPGLDPGVRRPPPSSRLGRILARLRIFRDSLNYQGRAVGAFAGIYFVVSLVLGLNAATGHLSALGTVFALIWMGLFASAFEGVEEAAGTLAMAVVIAWLVVLVILLVHDQAAVAYAYVLPLVVFLGLLAMLPAKIPLRDTSDLAHALGGGVRSAPWLAPVLLGLFAIALFNSSLWRAADELSAGSIAGVAVLTLGILLLTVRARLRSGLGDVLRQRTIDLAKSRDEWSENLQREVALVARPADDAERIQIERCVDLVLRDHWPTQPAELVAEFEKSERKVLLAPITIRLLLTVLLVGLIVLLYAYVLAWLAVPKDVAIEWSSDKSPLFHLNFVIVDFALPGRPYLHASMLLSLIATAGFLGSATLDDRVASPLTNEILVAPVTRFLVLALPYASIVREARGSAPPEHDSH